MFYSERQKKILQLLQKEADISIDKLAAALYVSIPTIRRDLQGLEEEGKVIRTYGRVELRTVSDTEVPLLLRESLNNASKQIIAKKAAVLIHNGDIIFLDASSTVSYLIPHLERFHDIIVVTPSPKTSILLGQKGIKHYCTGGRLIADSVTYVGSKTERFFADFNADLCFFSSRGYTESGMITDSFELEVDVKKAMLKNAAKSYYLCDSSKKNKKYAFNICSIHDIEDLIDESENRL